MNDEKELDLGQARELIEAHLRTGLAGGSGRSGIAPVGGPAASPALETWKDGKTPKDPEAAILAQFDEEQFAVDSEYQGRPEIQKLAARLVEIRRAKRAKAPHESIVRAGDGVPSQAEYEKDKGALLKAERRDRLLAQIASAQERLAAMEGEE